MRRSLLPLVMVMMLTFSLLMPLIVLVAAILVVRRFGGRMRERARERMMSRLMSLCDGMMSRLESMPDSFPPKAMVTGIVKIREQNERILELLQERLPGGEPSGPAGEETAEKELESGE